MSLRAPDSNTFALEKDHAKTNKAAIALVRGIAGDKETISDENRKEIFRWCIRAEQQTGNRVLPWGELYDIVGGYRDDLASLTQRLPAFAEFVEELENGHMERISTPSPGIVAIATETKEETTAVVRRLYTSRYPKEQAAS